MRVASLIIFAAVSTLTNGQGHHLVHTPLGQVSGKLHKIQHDHVYQFLGIHYAESPTGSNRFEKPVPRNAWTGVLDATHFGPHCIQRSYDANSQSEDCLVLNIFVPHTLKPTSQKSVMLWVHGGGYTGGSGGDASNLAHVGDVIVVTINYRLGAFGFLSTFDDNSKGNYALWDMLEAIRFTKNNIAAFGGNPNAITIFGESAGGYAVGLLALSPLSQGLFQRVICESGVGISPRAMAFDPETFLKKFSDSLGCNTKNNAGSLDTRAFIACARQKSVGEVNHAQGRAGSVPGLKWRLLIGPTVDGAVLPRSPQELLTSQHSGLYNPLPDIDFMAGTNNREGSLMLGQLNHYQKIFNYSMGGGIPTRVLCDKIAQSFSNDYLSGSTTLSMDICSLYTTHSNLADQSRSILNLYGDMMFVAPTYATVTQHSKHNNGKRTYTYLFSQQRHNTTNPSWMTGATHGAEVSYVFGFGVINRDLSRQMMTYWTNFAKFGNPNGSASSSVRVIWPQFDSTRKSYMSLGPFVQSVHDLWPQRLAFWTKTVPANIGRLARRAGSTNILVG